MGLSGVGAPLVPLAEYTHLVPGKGSDLTTNRLRLGNGIHQALDRGVGGEEVSSG